jgi:hypothetical protein
VRPGSLYPRRLPDLPVPPRRYSTETDARYRERCWHWRIWLDHHRNRALLGGPPTWYASTTEVQDYELWRDQPTGEDTA